MYRVRMKNAIKNMAKTQGFIPVLVIALVLNILFFLLMTKEYHAISMAHGNVAYNFYQYTIPGINAQLTEYMYALQDGKNALIDFVAVRDIDFGLPNKPFPVNDTIGYGVLLGLLWKITNSLCFMDIIVVQIIMYLIMVYLIYRIGLWLFLNQKIAWYSAIAFLCYVPLIALNVHAVRDVWAAYGIIVLMYGALSYLGYEQGNTKLKSFFTVCIACIFFALCQWIRPTLFLAAVVATGLLLLTVFLKPNKRKRSVLIITILWLTNSFIFWLPFVQYNKTHYDRYLVSPAGQDLLEGLGEFENPWGHKLSDEYVAHLVEYKYGSKYGTPEFDDDAKKEFWIAYQTYPSIFWINIIKRLPMIILPALPWLFYEHSPYAMCARTKEKLVHVIMHPSVWIDFIARHIYMRLYILIGYLGLFLLLWNRKYSIALIICAVLLASVVKLPSHIEYRYLTPYYWVLCFGVGYLLKNISNVSSI